MTGKGNQNERFDEEDQRGERGPQGQGQEARGEHPGQPQGLRPGADAGVQHGVRGRLGPERRQGCAEDHRLPRHRPATPRASAPSARDLLAGGLSLLVHRPGQPAADHGGLLVRPGSEVPPGQVLRHQARASATDHVDPGRDHLPAHAGGREDLAAMRVGLGR